LPQDRVVAAAFTRVFNETMLRSLRLGRLVFPLTRAGKASGVRHSQDFIGVNYYTRELVKFNHRYRAELFGERILPSAAARSDLRWELYPEGLYRTLLSLRREQLPIYVTENGIADGGDTTRPEFLLTHVDAMRRAIEAGAAVRGYFHWTCFDNFEWAEGYSAKFGLIACDPLTQERRVRASGRLYAEICRLNGLPVRVGPPPALLDRDEPAGSTAQR
jgi:beta-glucosidase